VNFSFLERLTLATRFDLDNTKSNKYVQTLTISYWHVVCGHYVVRRVSKSSRVNRIDQTRPRTCISYDTSNVPEVEG